MSTYVSLMVGGLVLAIVGVAMIYGGLTSTDDITGDSNGGGLMLLGLALSGVGQLIFLIYVIAAGVFIGTRDARTHASG